MPISRNISRQSRQSRRERMRRIDHAFEIVSKIFFVGYLLFVLSAWISYRPELRISEVHVEGAQAVDSTAVEGTAKSLLAKRLLWKIDRNNLFLYPKRTMVAAIKDLDTHVKDVEIAVKGRKQLVIRVTEYSPEFLWCPSASSAWGSSSGGISTSTMLMAGCYFADDMGHLYAEAPKYSGNPFLTFETTVPGYHESSFLAHADILPKEEFNNVSMFLHKLSDLELSPRRVEQSGPHDFTVVTDEPWTIRWLSTRNPEEDAANLSLVLENLNGDHMSTSTLKSIDLRFGNKVFYR